MAKRQPTSERTSKSTEPTELDPEGSRLDTVPDTIDEARARAHERARERTGSDD